MRGDTMRHIRDAVVLVMLTCMATGCSNVKEETKPTADQFVDAFRLQNDEQLRSLADEEFINVDQIGSLYEYFEEHCGQFPFSYEDAGWETSSAAGCGAMEASTRGTFTYRTTSESPCSMNVTVDRRGDDNAVVGVHLNAQF
jgi:hypothetical protein